MDDGYMGSGKVIKRAIEKYGLENFEKVILETFEDSAAMFAKEAEVVTEEFLARDDTYNLRRGGFGGFDYINHLGRNFGRHISGSQKQLSNRGHAKRSQMFAADPEYKQQHCDMLKVAGIIGSQRMTELYPNGTFNGKTHTEETKSQMSATKRGTKVGIENSQFGTMWITNGDQNSKVKKDSVVPQGWKVGRCLKKSTASGIAIVAE
jgi:hypothetical protein